MRIFLLIFILLFFGLSANRAQVMYQLFDPYETYLYEDEQGFMHTVKWDSVYIGDATDYFFNYRTFQHQNGDYYTDQGISWMGYGIRRVYGDLNNYVLLEDEEEMIIMIGGMLGEEFPMYIYPNGNQIRGEITKIQEESFLGVTDSVKTIEIVKKDINGDEIQYDYNGFLIKVSKSHGMIQGFNFGAFPDGVMEEYTLVGAEKAGLGAGNLSFTDVFSMVPGDEIHVYEYLNSIQKSFEGMYIYDVLEKTFNMDENQVTLVVERCAHEIEVINPEQIEQSYTDTISLEYAVFSGTGEPCFRFPSAYPDIPFGSDPRTYSRQYYSTGIEGRLIKSYGELFNPADDLWLQYLDYYCPDYYIEGLGQYYYSLGLGGESYSEPVYFKQGGLEWGTPYDCNDWLSVQENNGYGIHVYPNPFTDKITVQTDIIKTKFSLYNASGQPVIENLSGQELKNIDVSHLSTGIYFYCITSGMQTVSGKLIKLE